MEIILENKSTAKKQRIVSIQSAIPLRALRELHARTFDVRMRVRARMSTVSDNGRFAVFRFSIPASALARLDQRLNLLSVIGNEAHCGRLLSTAHGSAAKRKMRKTEKRQNGDKQACHNLQNSPSSS
jgi:hypothetical protein